MSKSAIGKQLEAHLDSRGLSLYAASQQIALITNERVKTVHQRLTRLIHEPTNFILTLDKLLAAIGLRIKLEKID